MMKALAACAVVAGSSIGLLGCGSDDSAAPAPTPVKWPMDVATVWQHHFDAFVAASPDKIILDYDADSVVSIFDDTCGQGEGGFKNYEGEDAIKTMFTQLFSDLGTTANVIEPGPEAEGPHAKVINEKGLGGNAFLVWKTKGGTDGLAADKWIQYATDTFTFKTLDDGKYKIAKQNIVLTTKGVDCVANTDGEVVAPDDSTKIGTAWANHFDGFSNAKLDTIMTDYTEDSIVQVYDWTAAAADRFKVYKGVTAIRGMFDALFLTLNPAYTSDDPKAPENVLAPLLTVDADLKALFLVWTSDHVKHATDTFIFDDSGDKAIILRQNIVVHDTPAAAPPTLQIEV